MLEKELARLEEELKVLPYGSLRCTSSRGTDQFYVNGNYISKKQMHKVKGIAQREYDDKLVSVIKADCKCCSNWNLVMSHMNWKIVLKMFVRLEGSLLLQFLKQWKKDT